MPVKIALAAAPAEPEQPWGGALGGGGCSKALEKAALLAALPGNRHARSAPQQHSAESPIQVWTWVLGPKQQARKGGQESRAAVDLSDAFPPPWPTSGSGSRASPPEW